MATAKEKEAPAEEAKEKTDEKTGEKPGTDIEKTGSAALEEMSDAELAAAMEEESKLQKGELKMGEDVRLPGLILVQPTSSFVNEGLARPGQLLHNQTQEAHDAFDVVVCRIYKTRVLFGKELGETPLCTSPNAEDGYGDPGDQLPKKGPLGGGACSTCPEANWREGGRCQLRYNYLALPMGTPDDPDEEWAAKLPVGFMMHGTSAKIATRLNSVLVAQQYYWSYVITLTSQPMENEKGAFRGWEFRKARETTMEEKLRAFRMAKMLREQSQSITVVGQEPGGDADPAPGGDDIPF